MATEPEAGTEAANLTEAPKKPDEGKLLAYWPAAIKAQLKAEEKWRKSADKAIKVFEAEEKEELGDSAPASFNILYSNTETLCPALFSRAPIVDIRPRVNDPKNPMLPAIKKACTVLERVLSHAMDAYDFVGAAKAAVRDYVLPGRGGLRVCYEGRNPGEEQSGLYAGPLPQKVWFEGFQWDDYLIGPGRRWCDVEWNAFRHFMTLDEIADDFGKDKARGLQPDSVPGEWKDKQNDPEAEKFKRVTVWEVWDKRSRTEVWLTFHGDNRRVLKVVEDDPLRLDQFFPVPRPLLAVESPRTLLPRTLYSMYQSLAEELETVTDRIQKLADGIRAKALYVGEASDDFQRWAKAGETTFTPIALQELASLIMRGGDINNLIAWWPIEALANVLQIMTARQAAVIQSIYEITGISDIQRGASDPGETATAQSIKANFGGQRLTDRQKEVQRLCRDVLRLGAEVVGAVFDPQVMSIISGVQVDEQTLAILRSDLSMSVLIDIETDSTIEPDLMFEQQRLAQFSQGFGALLGPLKEMMGAGYLSRDASLAIIKGFTGKFRLGREVEEQFDAMGQQPPPPPPGPSKEQIDAQIKGQELQLKQAEMQGKQQIEQQKIMLEQEKLNLERQKFGFEAQYKAANDNRERERFEYERSVSEGDRAFNRERALMTEKMGREDMYYRHMGTSQVPPVGEDGQPMEPPESPLEAMLVRMEAQQQQNMQMLGQMFIQAMQQIAEGQQQIAAMLSAPKVIEYGPGGRPIGSRIAGVQ